MRFFGSWFLCAWYALSGVLQVDKNICSFRDVPILGQSAMGIDRSNKPTGTEVDAAIGQDLPPSR